MSAVQHSPVPEQTDRITETDQLDQEKPCNLCKSNEYRLTIDGRYGQIVTCKSCGMMYRKTMRGHYPLDCYGGAEHHDQQVAAKQVLQLQDYAKSLPIAERYLGTNDSERTLLEIGSYHGEFLRLAADSGYRVTGLEPNQSLAEVSRHRYPQFPVHGRFLRDAKFPDASFDMVCLFHVIEHMNYPLEELEEIYRILKTGGVAVIETPRYDTIWFKLLKERERSVIPEHFYFFTRNSLKRMVSRAGFAVIRIDNVGRTLTLDRLLGNVCKVLGSRVLTKIINGASKRFHFEKIKLHVNTGDMMRIYVAK